MFDYRQLEPQRVFYYFEKICEIPHGSGDTWQISNYLVEFAKEHSLWYRQDALGNVIIKKSATPGYEGAATVMIQGHMDMVCEKEADYNIDFHTQGISLRTDGEILYAQGTTLGGDDGIAVAMALAILEAQDIRHPDLEVVITVDEEIGMLGASALDTSDLKAKLMLNLDSEDEGQFLIGCAGGVTSDCTMEIPLVNRKEDADWKDAICMRLCIDGLLGGHSGMEIHKQRANANKLLFEVLATLLQQEEMRVAYLDGGKKDNAIPRTAYADLLIPGAKKERIVQLVESVAAKEKRHYEGVDAGLCISLQPSEKEYDTFMEQEACFNMIHAMHRLPNGVICMNKDLPDLVQTSLNMGVLTMQTDMEKTKGRVKAGFSVRSSVNEEKQQVTNELKQKMQEAGGTYEENGAYPAWEYKPESKLRDLMVEIFEQQFGKTPTLDVIHAGVECGLFADKIEGLDCVSYGPQMYDIHTPKERLYVDSVARIYAFTIEILKRLCEI